MINTSQFVKDIDGNGSPFDLADLITVAISVSSCTSLLIEQFWLRANFIS